MGEIYSRRERKPATGCLCQASEALSMAGTCHRHNSGNIQLTAEGNFTEVSICLYRLQRARAQDKELRIKSSGRIDTVPRHTTHSLLLFLLLLLDDQDFNLTNKVNPHRACNNKPDKVCTALFDWFPSNWACIYFPTLLEQTHLRRKVNWFPVQICVSYTVVLMHSKGYFPRMHEMRCSILAHSMLLSLQNEL